MRAKFINENYPPGAKDDPNAPWNEREDPSQTVLKISGGDYELITSVQVAEDDWEEIENLSIDPYDMDELISQKLGLDFEQMEVNGETIEIQDVSQKDENFFLTTDQGNVELTLGELIELSEKGFKRQMAWRNKNKE
jgi:hypothetical protein